MVNRSDYLQWWCMLPVELHGHKLPCSLPEGHEGDCEPSKRSMMEHDCDRSGCERSIEGNPLTDRRLPKIF